MRWRLSYKDIKGQDKAVDFLKRVVANGKTAQAYLFMGPPGIGKKLAAINFAKALNCLTASEEKPCDECASCKKIASSNHPDTFVIAPDKEGGSIKIEKIRQMIKDVSLKPYEGRKKIYIVDDASSMTQESANALLKTLEEPSAESVIILIAEKMNDMLKTIISRSQIVRFLPMKADDIKKVLKDEHGLNDTSAHVIAHLSGGRLGHALSLKDEGLFDKRSGIMDALAKRSFFDSDFDTASKEGLQEMLDLALTWYRDMLITKTKRHANPAELQLINIDRQKEISEESKYYTIENLENAIQNIISTKAFLNQNANPKLVMSVLGLKIQGSLK